MENIINFQQDLLSYPLHNLQIIAKYYGIGEHLNNPVDLAWAIAIFHHLKYRNAKMGGAFHPLNTHRDTRELLELVNKSLENRNIIVRFSKPGDRQALLKLMKEKGCHNQTESLVVDGANDIFTIVAIDKITDDLMAFVTWNIEQYAFKYIYISYSCTAEKYRRQGLSTILRLFPIQMGIDKRADFIVSFTGEDSRRILVDKFGFKHSAPDDFWIDVGDDSGWVINVNTKLDIRIPGSLDKFYSFLEKS